MVNVKKTWGSFLYLFDLLHRSSRREKLYLRVMVKVRKEKALDQYLFLLKANVRFVNVKIKVVINSDTN